MPVSSPEQFAGAGLIDSQARHFSPAILRALRPYQYAKNILVFVPLVTSHKFLAAGMLMRIFAAFCCICLCASATYVVNDLADLDSDRHHRSKYNRPFASGSLSRAAGLFAAPLLLVCGIAFSRLLPGMATIILLFYTALSIAYTFWFKQRLLADVLVLSALYLLRILEGAAAASIPVSPWLLAFSLFLLLSFAFSKRVTEMVRSTGPTCGGLAGRGYLLTDISVITSLGVGSGYLACLVLSLYINNRSVHELYPHPGWLWLLLPLLLYWIGRFWVLTTRGCVSDDPLVFILKDPVTYGAVFCGVAVLFLGMMVPFGIPGISE